MLHLGDLEPGLALMGLEPAVVTTLVALYAPPTDHKQPDPRHIEVKGRVKGAATVTITRNEMLHACNQGDKFVLVIVLVSEDDSTAGPYYIRRPFDREPGWGVCSITYKLSELLGRAERLW